MTKVRYFDSAYHLTGRNIIKDTELEFKFDSGAVATFVTIGALTGNNNSEKFVNTIQKSFQEYTNNGKISNVFNSSSNTDMLAFRVHAKNITLGNIQFEDFYYWLSPMQHPVTPLPGTYTLHT